MHIFFPVNHCNILPLSSYFFFVYWNVYAIDTSFTCLVFFVNFYITNLQFLDCCLLQKLVVQIQKNYLFDLYGLDGINNFECVIICFTFENILQQW